MTAEITKEKKKLVAGANSRIFHGHDINDRIVLKIGGGGIHI